MPNFLVIGAPRAGTTSLHHYLDQHPQVYMSPVKEPAFFKLSRGGPPAFERPADVPVARTIDEYLSLFEGASGERAVGEATPTYLQSAEAAERIRDAIPHAKLIAILRNPVERAFSGYAMRVSQGVEKLTFAQAVACELGTTDVECNGQRSYLLPGFYGRHLSTYVRLFERSRLRVYLYDDLDRRPRWLMRDIFQFLDVDPEFVPDIASAHNATRYPVKHLGFDRFLRIAPGKAFARRIVPKNSWARARRYVKRRNSLVPAFPPDLRQQLVESYRDDIGLTQELIGRDLSRWLAR